VTYVITEPCIDVKDKSFEVCLSTASARGRRRDRMLYIDLDECIDRCARATCPVTAIFEDDAPDNLKEYTALNAQWYKDKAAVRRGSTRRSGEACRT
jgi:NAD-dependent dihydropyrimidine dehydrogenase PreA subunit